MRTDINPKDPNAGVPDPELDALFSGNNEQIIDDQKKLEQTQDAQKDSENRLDSLSSQYAEASAGITDKKDDEKAKQEAKAQEKWRQIELEKERKQNIGKTIEGYREGLSLDAQKRKELQEKLPKHNESQRPSNQGKGYNMPQKNERV